MDKRLLLLVIMLYWRNADGFKGGASSGAHHGWGQPSDTFSPRTVQSSMSEVHVTGILPVEEVGSSLFPNKPLKSKSKLNLLQFVKGGSSSYLSMSHAETTPSSSVSASLPLSLNQQPSSSLASSGSTIPGVAGGLNLETQYAASGSGQVVSTLGESSSYPAKLAVSDQSTSEDLHVSSSQETSVQLAEASLPVFSKNVSSSSSSAPGATSTFQSSPALLSESLGQPDSSPGEVGYSGLSQGASSPYTPDSNTMLSSSISSQSSGDQSSPSLFGSSSQGSSDTFLASGFSLLGEVAGLSPLDLSTKSSEMSSQFKPLVVSSQSTNGQSSPSLHMVSPQSSSKSTDAATPLYTRGSVPYNSLSNQAQGSAISQGSSGAELFASSVPTRVGSGSYSVVSQSLSASSLYTPGSLMANKLDSLPLGVSSQSTNVQNSPNASTSSNQRRSGTRLATSSHFIPVQGGSSSVSLSLKPPGTLGQYTPLSPTKYVSAPMSAPQATTNSGSSYRVVSQVGSPSQMGASGQFTSQGGNYYRGLLPQSQATSSQYALGYSKPISPPQSTSNQSTSVLSSRKQYNSASQGSGSQFGASTGFASQGMSSSYSGSVQSQGTTSQLAPGSPSSYPGLSLSSPQAGPSTTVQGSRKQLTSTYTGSSGTQAGLSSFTLQGSTASGGSPQPQDTDSQFSTGSLSSYPGSSLPSRQGVASQSSSRKRFTSAYQGSSGSQFGASTGFASQGMSSSYSGSVQSQGTTSQFASGSSPYASVSLFSPQAGPSTKGSRKQLTSTYTGSSGTRVGSPTLLTLHGSTAYGGSRQPQDTASQFAPSSPYESLYCKCVLSPQGVDRHSSTVQSSQKQFTSSSGTQVGSSTPFTLQGSITYGGSPQLQGTASQFAPFSPSYPSVLSPSQGVVSQSTIWGSLKQLTSTFAGSSDTQAGSSTPFALQGGTAYGGSSQPQDTTSPSAPGSHSSYASASLSSPQAGPSNNVQDSRKRFTSAYQGGSGAPFGASTGFASQGMSSSSSSSDESQGTTSQFAPGSPSSYLGLSLSSPHAGPSTNVQGALKRLASTFVGSSGTQAGSSTPFILQGSTAYGGSPQPLDTASQFSPGSPSSYPSLSLSSPQGIASQSSQAYQGYSVSQSQKSQRWQPSVARTPVIQTSDAAASQGSASSPSSPMQLSSLSSAGGSSSRVSGLFVSAPGGSTSYGGSFQSQSLSTKYTPGSQLLPYVPSVAGQGTSSASASEVLSSHSSVNNQNAPAQPSRSSSSSHFYSIKG